MILCFYARNFGASIVVTPQISLLTAPTKTRFWVFWHQLLVHAMQISSLIVDYFSLNFNYFSPVLALSLRKPLWFYQNFCILFCFVFGTSFQWNFICTSKFHALGIEEYIWKN